MLGWGFGFSIVFAWFSLILLAPMAALAGYDSVAAPVYNFFGYVCHQMPSRSFHIQDHALAVCSRCFGVYSGLLAGFVVYTLFRPITETEPLPRFWLFLSLVPIGIDWMLGALDIWENTFFSRFVTGAILGVVCALYIVPAVVELFGLIRMEKRRKKIRTL